MKNNRYEIEFTNQFKKDYKKVKKQGKKLDILKEITEKLSRGQTLPEKYKNHSLKGNYNNCYECHLNPDWLLIYKINQNTLYLVRTGSHSELF